MPRPSTRCCPLEETFGIGRAVRRDVCQLSLDVGEHLPGPLVLWLSMVFDGVVAKWQRGGLQNRHSRVRFPPTPPILDVAEWISPRECVRPVVTHRKFRQRMMRPGPYKTSVQDGEAAKAA